MLFDTNYTAAVRKYLTLRGPTRKRAKTMCKASGHSFVDVTKEVLVWPHIVVVRRVCSRCGKKASAKSVTP